MLVSISEDFSTSIVLDSDLLSVPDSGLFLNSGAHPTLTLENIIAFLHTNNQGFNAWTSSDTYNKYKDSRNKSDLVVYKQSIYQSLRTANLNNLPNAVDSVYWVQTNIDSIKLKTLIYQVIDKVKSDLSLTKRLINSQKIYDIGSNVATLPNDYAAFVIQAKGSDYVSFKLNSVSIQKDGTTPINLYIINSGVLVDTLTITPNNKAVNWTTLDYEFSGSGTWTIAIDSTDVYLGNTQIDPLKYDGFTINTAIGVGDAPEDAVYSYSTNGIGIGLDISAYADADAYLTNNISHLGNLFRACFEYTIFQMFLHNPNNVSNRAERIQMNEDLLIAELKNLNGNTVAARYQTELKRARQALDKTYDTKLSPDNNDDFIIELTA